MMIRKHEKKIVTVVLLVACLVIAFMPTESFAEKSPADTTISCDYISSGGFTSGNTLSGDTIGSTSTSDEEISEDILSGFSIAGYSLSLYSESCYWHMGLTFYYDVPESVDYSSYEICGYLHTSEGYLKMAFGQAAYAAPYYTYDSNGNSVYKNNRHCITYLINMKNMADEVCFQVLYKGTVILEANKSVVDYAQYILSQPDKYADECALVKPLLNYGAAAQQYFNYETDNLANSILPEEERVIPTYDFSGNEVIIDDQLEGVDYYGMSLVLGSEIYYKIYFTMDKNYGYADDEGYWHSNYIFWDSCPNSSSCEKLHGQEGNLFWSLIYVSPSEVDSNHISTVKNVDMTSSIQVTYSLLTYANAVQKKSGGETTPLLQLIYAMYDFSQAYEAYPIYTW